MPELNWVIAVHLGCIWIALVALHVRIGVISRRADVATKRMDVLSQRLDVVNHNIPQESSTKQAGHWHHLLLAVLFWSLAYAFLAWAVFAFLQGHFK